MLKVVGASWLRTKISSYILGIIGVLAILALFLGQIERSQEDGNYAATVFYSEKTGYRIEYWGQSNELADISRGVARAYFRRDADTSGWSLLEVETNGSYSDEIQAYAAGVVEGALTWYLIHIHLQNTIRAQCEGKPLEKQCDKLRDALEKSVNIWKTRASERNGDDPFWHHVSLYYTQVDGIYMGWKYGVQRSANEFDTDKSDLYWLNSVSEVAELQQKLNITLEDPIYDKLPGLSSSFVRLVNDTSDGEATKNLFIAQNAVGSYSSMTRILKRYKLNYHLTSKKDSTAAPGASIDFSGYPGSVTSQDELYTITGVNHRMVISGTTLKNYNPNLWKEVNITEQMPIGPRISAANHLASNVSAWAHILASSNSGTACKQWLLVDYNKLRHLHTTTNSGSVPKAVKDDSVTAEVSVIKKVRHTVVHRSSSGRSNGLLWLVEQVPGLTHSSDLTEVFLERGYWAAFGVPYFKDVSNVTHTTKMAQLHGNIFSESNSPRSVVFKHGYKNATSIESITKLMRQNNMSSVSNESVVCDNKDPVFCEQAFWSVLGVRGDIVHHHKQPYGVIDTKIVNGTAERDTFDFVAISSPPYTAQNLSVVPMNKGNIATIYTDQFDDEPNISSVEIRDLAKQQLEEADQESEEYLLRNTIQPFQWSESDFKDQILQDIPDKWAFSLYRPNWVW